MSFPMNPQPNQGGQTHGNRQAGQALPGGAAQAASAFNAQLSAIAAQQAAVEARYAKCQAAQDACENAGLIPGEVTGWRLWRVVGGGQQHLVSMFRGVMWVPGCPMEGTPAHFPAGVYAFQDEAMALAEYAIASDSLDEHYALGKVEMWGEIVEHEWGYRAEFAQVVEITRSTIDLDGLRHRYLGTPLPATPSPVDEVVITTDSLAPARPPRGWQMAFRLYRVFCYLGIGFALVTVLQAALNALIGG